MGAQSCIINDRWHQQHLPHTIIRPVADQLEDGTLTVLAVNDTQIPYVGWVEVSFQLEGDRNELQVPILVSSDPAVATDPIIGYNVIEMVIKGSEAKSKGEKNQVAYKVSKAFSILLCSENCPKCGQVNERRFKSRHWCGPHG